MPEQGRIADYELFRSENSTFIRNECNQNQNQYVRDSAFISHIFVWLCISPTFLTKKFNYGSRPGSKNLALLDFQTDDGGQRRQ